MPVLVTCNNCGGTGAVPGKQPGTTKICPACKGTGVINKKLL